MEQTVDTATLLNILDESRRLIEIQAFDTLLQYTLTKAIEMVDADRGFVALCHPDQPIEIGFARDRIGNNLDDATDTVSLAVVEQVIRTGETVLQKNSLQHAQRQDTSTSNLQTRSIICVPLISYGKAIGALYVENRSIRSRFRDEHILPLAIYAGQAAVAIENAAQKDRLEERVAARTRELRQAMQKLEAEIEERERIEAQLRYLASTDSLTNIANRRSFFSKAEEEFARAKRSGQPVALLMMDIDHFKLINDQYGHATGDQVLVEFAQRCQQHIRVYDTLGRLGGEEFGILLPNCHEYEAIQIAERIRERFTTAAIDTDLDPISITVSIGVGVLHHNDLSIQATIERADRFLYQAKEAGRNCVVSESLITR